MKTETQEFLAQLTDPEDFAVRKGIREYLDNYNHKIWTVDVRIYEPKQSNMSREWFITVLAETEDVLKTYSKEFPQYILAQSSKIEVHSHTFEPDRKYCNLYQHFFSVWCR